MRSLPSKSKMHEEVPKVRVEVENRDNSVDTESRIQHALSNGDWDVLDSVITSKHKEVLDILTRCPQILHEIVKLKAPPGIVRKCLNAETVSVCLFNKIVSGYNTADAIGSDYSKDISELFDACVQCLKPKDLDITRIDVDFWRGHDIKSPSLNLEMDWSPFVIPLVRTLMSAGCSKPSQINLLRHGYCFSDPHKVKLALQACDLWKEYIFEPHSLIDVCKKVIRNSMTSVREEEFHNLGLPLPLCSFVTLAES